MKKYFCTENERGKKAEQRKKIRAFKKGLADLSMNEETKEKQK